MKIAVITDTHWGVRGDSPFFLNNTKKFLDSIFFPYIEKNDIKTVLHLGDLVDRRKYINYNTANHLRKNFLEKLNNKQINTTIIAGNHDTFYKNTNSINALDELISIGYENIKIYSDPVEKVFGETKILLLPWICDENKEQSYQLIRTTDAPICMGHLELQGFEMYKGSPSLHGDDPRSFDRFDVVCSGHYHHRSNSGNIYYLGSHGEFTWSDYDDPRGFHVFDTKTREIKFIQNTYTMFEKLWYSDIDKDQDDLLLNTDFDRYKEKIVKVIITQKTNPYYFDRFIDKLEKNGIIDMQIVEDHLNLNAENDKDIISEAESTIDIIKKYVNQTDIKNTNKDKLEKTIENLYIEASNIE
jgi:DNA repair exonuclease SbcCD nuclease subunit